MRQISRPKINPTWTESLHFQHWPESKDHLRSKHWHKDFLRLKKKIRQIRVFLSVSRRFFLKIPTFEPKNHENLEPKNTPKITKIMSKRPQNRGKITEKVLVWIYFWFFVTEMITFWAKLEDFPNFLGNFPKSRIFRGSWLVTEQKFLSRGSSSKSRISW